MADRIFAALETVAFGGPLAVCAYLLVRVIVAGLTA